MALPPHHFQQHYQTQQQQQPQEHQSKLPRNFLTIDGQISPPVATYYDPSNYQDQSQHPPYVPTFHVVGVAPGTVPVADGNDMGAELQWDCGRKRPEEQEFLENNSQMSSSIDFFKPRPVSTGLGLSFDNNTDKVSADSALLNLLGDDIDRELRRQNAEFDRFLKVQGERLRQAVLDKVQSSQLQMISSVEEKALQKLHEKEAAVESISKRNMDLEERISQLTAEAVAWQQRAISNENRINALKFKLQQVYAQGRDSKEGCGDSEVDDTASCCNGHGFDLHMLSEENNNMKELMTCKLCRINRVCMLLIPCRHLCLCKSCESKVSHCPLCMAPKYTGMEVYM